LASGGAGLNGKNHMGLRVVSASARNQEWKMEIQDKHAVVVGSRVLQVFATIPEGSVSVTSAMAQAT
jgi:hypothetical protein